MVAVLLAVLSTFAAFGCGQSEPQRQISREDLLRHWKHYQGQEVVVSGVVVFGEGAIMYLPRRPDLPIRDTGDTIEAMFVIPSITVEQNPGKLEADYLKYSRESVVVKLRGLFTGADTRKFGHQNCCRFRLEITKVLSLRDATSADR